MFIVVKISQIITKNYALMALLNITLLLSCSDNSGEVLPIHGKYKMFSNNPSISQFIANEDNYIQVNRDKTIVYNSTINMKPKFNFKGEYTYEKESNTLNIRWSDGKLPDKLQIEVIEGDYVIKIGETSYKKEKIQNK